VSPASVYTPQTLKEIPASPPPFAVLGNPVAHSLSPVFQEAGLRACSREEPYVRIEVKADALKETVETMRNHPFSGWNITLPHKAAMADLVDEQRDSARLLGGVNTVLNDAGTLIGWNTDGEGWKRAVREQFSLDIRDLRILIIGAGGAGAALARQAAREGCPRLILCNRSVDKAHELVEELGPQLEQDTRLLGASARLKAVAMTEDALAPEMDTVDLIVNATSLGLKASDPAVLPDHLFQPHHCVFDTVYRSRPTALLESARQAGARATDGLSMLLHQGALSFELWTGLDAPLEKMREALKNAIAS